MLGVEAAPEGLRTIPRSRSTEWLVVDGAYLSRFGATAPTLRQLDTAVEALRRRYPDSNVVVVVDASLRHRLTGREKERFENDRLTKYLVPPAGTVGGEKAFMDAIAARCNGTVVSGHHNPSAGILAVLAPGSGWDFRKPGTVTTPRHAA